MEKNLWIVVVFIAGALLPIQAGFNGRMGKALGSPEWAVMISFFVGFLAMIVYVLVNRQGISTAAVQTVPAYTWVSGVLGAIYVTSVVLAFPRLGMALTFGLIVAGQLASSVLLDHFKILVADQHPVNVYRILGVALIVAGVVIIRKF